MKTKTWTYIITATLCVALSVSFLASPAVSTAQEGGQTVVAARVEPADLAARSGYNQEEATVEAQRALFFFQNQGFASYYQQVAAADDSVEIVVASDVDSFLEQAVTRPGWDVVAAFPDPGDRSEPGLVDHLSTILDSISSNQGGVQMLVAEVAARVQRKLGVNSIAPAIEQEGAASDTVPPLRFEAWMEDSHLSAIFFSDGRYTVREVVGDQEPLIGLGKILNENRIDFSSLPANRTQRGGILGPPWCCGVVWGACINTTGNVGACGLPFGACLIDFGGNGCHLYDGICSNPPGGAQFWLCDDGLCTGTDACGGCELGPANETCYGGNLIGCTGGTCGP